MHASFTFTFTVTIMFAVNKRSSYFHLQHLPHKVYLTYLVSQAQKLDSWKEVSQAQKLDGGKAREGG